MANTPPSAARAKKFASPGHYTDKDREKIPAEDFAGPGRTYPIVTQEDVHDAAGLIGHAANPAAVKARIKAIAKRKGFSLPKAWQEEESGRMAQQPQSDPALDAEVVRDDPPEVTRFALPSSIRVVDPADRIVEVCATSEAVDSYHTIFGYGASKDAFQRWAGNVREMHDRKAVGRRVEVRCDDDEKKIYVRARISRGAEDTWQKLLDGTLTGASIGASKVQWQHERRGADLVPVATRYDLVELSLVDAPSNPDSAGVTFVRAAAMVDDLFDELPAPHATPLDDDLRPVTLDGVGSVETQVDQPDDLDEQGGPPADPTDATFAAKRPAGTLPEPLLGAARAAAAERVPAEEPSQRASVPTGVASLTQQVERLMAESMPSAGGVGAVTASTPAMAPASAVPVTMPPMEERAAAAAPAAPAPEPPVFQTTPLAPFGAGAPLPANQGHLPTARQVANAQRAERNAAEYAVRAAGDQAEALFPPWDRLEDYPSYVRRRALARGAAEKAVIDQQYVERRARELAEASAVVSRPAPGRAPIVRSVAPAPAPVAVAVATPAEASSPASTPPADATPTPVAVATMTTTQERAATLAGEKPNAAIVPTGPIPPAPQMSGSNGVVTAAAGNTRHAHVHSHAHATSHEAHQHDTLHTHEDGTTHAHPHRHDHAHHDHGDEHVTMPGVASRAEMMTTATEGGHTHSHTHPHDHTHVFRAGMPTDAALVLADAERMAERAATTAADERARSTMSLEATAPTPTKPLSGITPASGSAMYGSSQMTGKPKSPQMSVHPQEVGHLDLLNTEDANATTFGVPAEVEIEATPADGEVAEPVGFHEGGHQPGNLTSHTGLSPANKSLGPRLAAQKTADGPLAHDAAPDPTTPMDQDLDHDAAEDAAEAAAALAGNAGTLAGLDQGARPSTKNAALIHESDKPASRAAKMDDDMDYDGDEDEAEDEGDEDEGGETPAPAKSAKGRKSSRRDVDEAEEARKGARISAESRAALHAVRDGQVTQLRSLCQHCGCDECQAYTDALDEMVQGASEPATPPSPEEVARLAEVFGRQRLLAHLVQTGVRAETERLAALVEDSLARLHDLELTLAAQANAQAQQRAAAPNVERLQERMHAAEDARLGDALTRFRADLDTDLATALVAAMNQVMSPIAQRMEAVASLGEAVDALKADVERIAAQPVSGGGPAVGLADKRLPFDPDALRQTVADASGLGSATASASLDPSGNPNDPRTQIAALQALARTTTDPNMQMALARQVAALEVQANGGQPPTRRLIGGTTPASAAATQVLGARAAYRSRQNGGGR